MFLQNRWGMVPWWPIPELLSWYPMKPSYYNSFEDHTSTDVILDVQCSNELQRLYCMAGYLNSSPSNGCQTIYSIPHEFLQRVMHLCELDFPNRHHEDAKTWNTFRITKSFVGETRCLRWIPLKMDEWWKAFMFWHHCNGVNEQGC